MKTNIFILILVLFFSFFSSMFSQVVINDEYFGNQWYLYMPGDENTRADIRVLDAWSRTMGNSNQKIADIEGDHGGANGYPLTSHDDLQGRITTQGQGFVGEHSTAVAGLLVANHNTIGIAGVNKFAHLRSYLYSNYDQWADKVRDARLDGNKIINISQGTPDDIFQVGNRLAEAYNSNIVSVVSVGNNSTSITNPAVYASVIAVGSSTKDNTSSFFSNYGPQIEFLAPGGSDFTQNNPKNIFTTSSNGDYVYTVGGTSYAAPLVSGAASLLLAYKPNLSNEDVKNILILSCDKLPEMNGANFTNKCGYGRINLKKAVQLLESPCVLDNNLTIAGGTDVGSGEMEQVVITDASGLSYDVYLVIEHEIRRTINFSTPNENVHVWGSGSASVGWSKERPLFGQNYCEVVPGSVTSSSAELKTYIYEVRTIDLTYLGYYPATANNVVFAYSVLSHPTQVNINLSVSQSPEGGPEGTYEVNGENVGASFNGTMYSSQTIEAIPPNTEWVFYQWSDGNTSNPRTLDASLDIYSVYKGTHISNDQNAYLNNSQSKFVQTPNGAQHIVYESMEDIWYEMSTDGGSTWQIMNDGKPLNTNIAKKPSMDYSGNYVAIVFQESNGGYYEIKLVTFYPDLDSYVLGQNTLVNFDFLDSYSSDANPVIGWSNSNRAIIVWSGAYAGPFGTESALIYKYCQITQTTFLILESGNVLNATEKSVNPTVFYNEYAYSTKNFHLAWEEQTTSSTSKIFYQRLYPDGSEEIQFADYYEASYGSGYSKNYNPAIVSNDFQNLGGRREDIRLSWIGYRDAQQEEELLKGNAASAGDTRVLHKHKLFSWSGLSVFGDNVGGMSQNHGDDIIGYYQAYGLAWSEVSGSTVTNKYVRVHGTTTIRTLDTDGKQIQVNNSTDYDDMYVNSFQNSTSPYSFELSEDLSEGLSKENSLAIHLGREGVVVKDDAEFYFAIGDIILNGENVNFVDFDDSLGIEDQEMLNEYLLSLPFAVGNNSSLTYGVQYGIVDSLLAVTALSDGEVINFKVQLIDDQTEEVIGLFDNISYSQDNVFQYNNIGYQVDMSGIGNRTVRFKLTVETEADCDFFLSKRFADEVILGKSGYKQVKYQGSLAVTDYAIEQNYPNPFNPSTTIRYQIPQDGFVTLKVYDILGKEVVALVNEEKSSGKYEVNFNASSLASGVYLYRLIVNARSTSSGQDYVDVKKMILIK